MLTLPYQATLNFLIRFTTMPVCIGINGLTAEANTTGTELCMKIRGYYAYFAISGNFKFLDQVYHNACMYWYKWLNRRSQYNSYTTVHENQGLLCLLCHIRQL